MPFDFTHPITVKISQHRDARQPREAALIGTAGMRIDFIAPSMTGKTTVAREFLNWLVGSGCIARLTTGDRTTDDSIVATVLGEGIDMAAVQEKVRSHPRLRLAPVAA